MLFLVIGAVEALNLVKIGLFRRPDFKVDN